MFDTLNNKIENSEGTSETENNAILTLKHVDYKDPDVQNMFENATENLKNIDISLTPEGRQVLLKSLGEIASISDMNGNKIDLTDNVKQILSNEFIPLYTELKAQQSYQTDNLGFSIKNEKQEIKNDILSDKLNEYSKAFEKFQQTKFDLNESDKNILKSNLDNLGKEINVLREQNIKTAEQDYKLKSIYNKISTQLTKEPDMITPNAILDAVLSTPEKHRSLATLIENKK